MPRWLGFMGPWGVPPDGPAWGAVGVALLALAIAALPERDSRDLFGRISSRAFVGAAAFAAAFLSLGYIAFYLRGGPRIVDATTYFLQGRALSEGDFAWRIPEPTASFRGRFLLAHDDPHRGMTIAGIFPPGYPLLLSFGFAVGAPMAVGPALAAALVVATFALARTLAHEAGMDRATSEQLARLAAVLSILSAALRYHTADTMAHGACALAFTCAITAALHARGDARPQASPWMFLLSGAALGFVVATRFASAIALGAVLAWLALRSGARARALLACALGALPGVALLLVAQYSATGSLVGSTQRAYYAASDGPPGCFHYGFGAGIGCLFEHGDFVRARLANGFGPLAALGTTLRRLGHHFADVTNFGPLALVGLVPASRAAWRTSGVRAALATVAALILAYVPFYFDGDYPGAGARFYADALPIEHALVALGVAHVALHVRLPLRRVAAVAVAVASLGFAVHMAYAHEQLRVRDGGNPMFEPDVLARAHVPPPVPRGLDEAPPLVPPPSRALLFVETDHGFDLAHDPGVVERATRDLENRKPGAPASTEATGGLLVVRARGDDHDRLVYEQLGRPSSWIYRFKEPPPPPRLPGDPARDAGAPGESVGSVEAWLPQPSWGRGVEAWRFESENEWPPLSQTGSAWAEPTWEGAACVSPSGSGRVLTVRNTGGDASEGTVSLALPIPRAGRWRVTPRVLSGAPAGGEEASGSLDLLGSKGEQKVHWSLEPAPAGGAQTCIDLLPRDVDADKAEELVLQIHLTTHGTTRLDRVTLTVEPR